MLSLSMRAHFEKLATVADPFFQIPAPPGMTPEQTENRLVICAL